MEDERQSTSGSELAAAEESEQELQSWSEILEELASTPINEKFALLEKKYRTMYDTYNITSAQIKDIKIATIQVLEEENTKLNTQLTEVNNKLQKRQQEIANISHNIEMEREMSRGVAERVRFQIKGEMEMHAKEKALLKSHMGGKEAGNTDSVGIFRRLKEDADSGKSKNGSDISHKKKQLTELRREVMSWKGKFEENMSLIDELMEVQKNVEAMMPFIYMKHEKLKHLSCQTQCGIINLLTMSASDGDASNMPYGPKTEKRQKLEDLRDKLKQLLDQLLDLDV